MFAVLCDARQRGRRQGPSYTLHINRHSCPVIIIILQPKFCAIACLGGRNKSELHLQVEAMPPAATAHALLCRDALLAITERVLTRSK